MQFFKETTKFDFMGKRRFFGTISAVAVLASLVLVFTIQPRWGIDFVGGTEIQVKFVKPTTPADVRGVLQKMGLEGYEVVSFGGGDSEYLVRLREISSVDIEEVKFNEKKFREVFSGAKVDQFTVSPGGDKLTIRADKNVPILDIENAAKKSGFKVGTQMEQQAEGKSAATDAEDEDAAAETTRMCESATCTWPSQGKQIFEVALKGISEDVMDSLRQNEFGQGALKMRSEWVGPKVGEQLRTSAVSAVLFAMLFIMLYVALRFDLRFSPGGVVALFHDVLITMGIFVIFRIEFTLATVAALLTIVGYSINDTIVVFDRIRENIAKVRGQQLANVVNVSVNETLSRTIMTSATTLVATIVLLFVGWNTSLRDFSLALTIGIVVGTYSSIFIASPIAVWCDRVFFSNKKA